jgi:creatinine amidohydrolase
MVNRRSFLFCFISARILVVVTNSARKDPRFNMRLDDLNWMDVEEYLITDDRIIVVLGSCEQHAYLSLLTDVRIPLALADAASQKVGVLVAPPLNFGISPYFLAYPGTISLRTSTFLDVVEDMIRSLYGYGFRHILVLNGHGGNEPARSRLTELANQLVDLDVAWYSWWTSHSVEAIALKHEFKPAHANWLEAFPFTKVSEMPSGEKNPPHFKGIPNAVKARELYGDGNFGGPYQVAQPVMEELFAAALEDVLFLLEK